jgi:hypothetical protein
MIALSQYNASVLNRGLGMCIVLEAFRMYGMFVYSVFLFTSLKVFRYYSTHYLYRNAAHFANGIFAAFINLLGSLCRLSASNEDSLGLLGRLVIFRSTYPFGTLRQ